MKYLVFAVLGLTIWGLLAELKATKADRDTYKSNVYVLLTDVEHYRTKDSLNVISTGELQLKLSEFKKYRSEDLEEIKKLRVDLKRIKAVTTTEATSEYKFAGVLRDTIFNTDTIRCITVNDPWFDFTGCLKDSTFKGSLTCWDSLVYVEHIVPRRLLFIKWGIKERRQEILNKNPNTKILSTKFTTIR